MVGLQRIRSTWQNSQFYYYVILGLSIPTQWCNPNGPYCILRYWSCPYVWSSWHFYRQYFLLDHLCISVCHLYIFLHCSGIPKIYLFWLVSNDSLDLLWAEFCTRAIQMFQSYIRYNLWPLEVQKRCIQKSDVTWKTNIYSLCSLGELELTY